MGRWVGADFVFDQQTIILLAVPVLLTLWVYFGKQAAFVRFFPSYASRPDLDVFSTIYEYSCAFTAMFIVPALLLKIILKKTVSSFGLGMGDHKAGFRAVLLIAPLLVLIAYFAAQGTDMQAEYPLSKSAAAHWQLFMLVEIFYLLYYIGWEFFFRGFMLNGLKERFGVLAAVLIQIIPSTLVHIGKPFGETFGAIIGGLLFGFVAVRTRSIWYPVMLHAILGISTDLFVLLHIQ
jgi:membrane protease YdiL (CAAX protease family)